MPQSAGAAITKYCSVDGLKNDLSFVPVLGARKSKIKLPIDLVSDEGLLPGLQMVTFLLSPRVVEREEALISFYSLLGC